MTTSIIKYAIDIGTNKTVYIDSVSNGLSCNCICDECKMLLIAIQGKSENHREWHFRHYIESNCKGGQETAIHKFAKQIIVDNNQIQIPEKIIFYTSARQEKKFQLIVPDVIVNVDGVNVFFEIEVTHPVDSFKDSFYKKGKHKSIKIDLSNISYDIRPDELKELVLSKEDNKAIIFWQSDIGQNTFLNNVIEFCKENPVISIIFGIILLRFILKRRN